MSALSRPSLNLPAMRSNVRDRRKDLPCAYHPKYFSDTEFQICNPSCEREDMDEDFLRKLDKLRELCGFPLTLTCAYRSVEHDKSRGRSGTSFHCAGRAVDIYCTQSDKRFSIILHAPMVGLNGIGVAGTFVHVDDRNIPACWTY